MQEYDRMFGSENDHIVEQITFSANTSVVERSIRFVIHHHNLILFEIDRRATIKIKMAAVMQDGKISKLCSYTSEIKISKHI